MLILRYKWVDESHFQGPRTRCKTTWKLLYVRRHVRVIETWKLRRDDKYKSIQKHELFNPPCIEMQELENR